MDLHKKSNKFKKILAFGGKCVYNRKSKIVYKKSGSQFHSLVLIGGNSLAENNIAKKVEDSIKEIIENLGYVLYDIEYAKEGKEYHLCVFIDKEDGNIDINDCQKITEAINPILDEKDYIKEQYYLEVSSTGLERKLRKKWHYEKQIGNKIKVKLFSKIDNRKEIIGILKAYNDEFLILNCDGKEIKIENSKISEANTVFDWKI